MGVRIIESNSDSDDYAVLYCSTTMTAFGPVFDNAGEAEEFLEWLPGDARSYSDAELRDKIAEFRDTAEERAAEKRAAEEED
jgi:hypothetical protein